MDKQNRSDVSWKTDKEISSTKDLLNSLQIHTVYKYTLHRKLQIKKLYQQNFKKLKMIFSDHSGRQLHI